MVLIDIPVVAYKTWAIDVMSVHEDGTKERNVEAEEEIRRMMERSGYAYSSDHVHTR